MNHPLTSPIDSEDRLRRRRNAARRLLQMHFDSHVGHIGGNLSALDILLTTYHEVLTSSDQFILSKGHAAGALYVTLWSVGRLSDEDLKQFHRDNTLLGGHPPAHGIDDIPFATGSLGHGLGLSCGVALAKRLQQQTGRVFCLTSDGEWNEGSTWESLIFARHRDLKNLTIIVDQNGLQGFGTTEEVANLSPLAEKFRSFGSTTLEIDGHDSTAIAQALSTDCSNGPLIVVANTTKGHGVSFMENRVEWHYLPLNQELFASACAEVPES